MEEIKWVVDKIAILGNKWIVAILLVIFMHELSRFSQIKKKLKMNSKTLSKKLDTLVTIGLVKKIDGKNKRSYDYLLTEMGRNICSSMLEINKIIGFV